MPTKSKTHPRTTTDPETAEAKKLFAKAKAKETRAKLKAERTKVGSMSPGYSLPQLAQDKAKAETYAAGTIGFRAARAERTKQAKAAKVEAGVKMTRAKARKARDMVVARNGEVLPSAVAKVAKPEDKTAHGVYHAQWRKAVATFATNEGFSDWVDSKVVKEWRKAVADGNTVLGLKDWRGLGHLIS